MKGGWIHQSKSHDIKQALLNLTLHGRDEEKEKKVGLSILKHLDQILAERANIV